MKYIKDNHAGNVSISTPRIQSNSFIRIPLREAANLCLVVKLVSVEHSRATPDATYWAVIMCHYAPCCALKSVFSDHSDLLAKVLIILLSEQAYTVELSCGENKISSKEKTSVSSYYHSIDFLDSVL